MTESDQRVKKETCASFGGISLTGLKAERLPSPTQEVKTPILSAIPDAGFSVAWSVPAFSVIPDTKPIVPLESPKIRNDPSFDLARFLVQKEDVAEPGPMLAPLEQASIEVQLIKEEGEASEEGECSEDDEPSRNNVSLDQPASSKPVAAHVTGQVANPGKRKRNRKSRKSESTGADADPSVAAQNQDPSQRDQKKKERRLNHQQQQKTLLRLSGPGTLLTDNGTMTKRELEATRSQFSKQKTHASREMKLSKLKTQECSFWKQGLCTQGDQCTYSHDCPGSDPRSKQLCRFVKSGGCIAGSTCPYSHDLKISPCVFFHMKGGCRAGASCPFSHAPITQEQRAMMEYEQKGFASYASKRNQIYSTSIKAPTPGDPIHSSSLNELGKIDP